MLFPHGLIGELMFVSLKILIVFFIIATDVPRFVK